MIGVFGLFCILVSNFTGYLLPWDQLSYWAITICTGMIGYIPLAGSALQNIIRGGPEIGSATLTIFYTIHTTVIPVLLIILLPLHFWRVRKAGGVVVPRDPGDTTAGTSKRVLFVPNLLMREVAVALVLIAFVMVVSVGYDAPLGDPANPGMSPNPAKAPWYFLGLQELLFHFHPLFAVFIIPVLIVGALLYLPYARYDSELSGHWFLTRRGLRMSVIAAACAVFLTPVWIILDEFWIDAASWLPGLPPAISQGLFPLIIIIASVMICYSFLKRAFSASNNEAIQAVFTFLFVGLVILTVTGIWFRGVGMALMWP